MFFKKRRKPVSTANVPAELMIFTEMAQTLFYGMSGDDAASLSATIMLDEHQRVSGIDNLSVDGVSKLPHPDLVEAVNKVSARLMKLDKKYRLKSLHVQIADGKVHTSADYLS